DQFERYALVESELTAKPCSRLRRCFRVSWRPRCSRRAIRRRISHDVAAFRIAAQRGHADAIESLEEGTRARLTHDFAPMHELASVHDAGGLILAAWPGVSALGETSAPACRARDCHRDRGRLQLACGFAHLLRTDCDCSAAYGELLGCAGRRARPYCDYTSCRHEGACGRFELGGLLLVAPTSEQSHDPICRLPCELLGGDLFERAHHRLREAQERLLERIDLMQRGEQILDASAQARLEALTELRAGVRGRVEAGRDLGDRIGVLLCLRDELGI